MMCLICFYLLQTASNEGRTPQIFYRHYLAFVKVELNVSELARVCDLSRNTVYKYIKLLEK